MPPPFMGHATKKTFFLASLNPFDIPIKDSNLPSYALCPEILEIPSSRLQLREAAKKSVLLVLLPYLLPNIVTNLPKKYDFANRQHI